MPDDRSHRGSAARTRLTAKQRRFYADEAAYRLRAAETLLRAWQDAGMVAQARRLIAIADGWLADLEADRERA